jgi:carbon monoxide dehydrogenase subunit G
MAKIRRSITIQAPVEKVFAYVTDPMTLTEWMVGMMDVSNVSGSGADLRLDWRYKMAGIPFSGQTQFTEYVPNERSASESKGGIPSTFRWKYEQDGAATKLDLEVDYTIPVPVLGKLAEKLVLKRNEREADLWMENIKDRLEQ